VSSAAYLLIPQEGVPIKKVDELPSENTRIASWSPLKTGARLVTENVTLRVALRDAASDLRSDAPAECSSGARSAECRHMFDGKNVDC
jgi:hypothetical protein